MITALLALAVPTGCDPKHPETPAPVSTPSAVGSDGCAPMHELAGLDTRQPVPLQPMMAWHQKQNMMQHLVAIQRITAGLAAEDWEEIASASALIESSPQMQQMCEHMGAGADGFTAMALDFHRRADAIGESARAHDGAAVLRATADTLLSCTGCHAAFRQDVVDAETWQARTGSADSQPMHHEMR
jgi:uncharacterized protein involved in copper resistance